MLYSRFIVQVLGLGSKNQFKLSHGNNMFVSRMGIFHGVHISDHVPKKSAILATAKYIDYYEYDSPIIPQLFATPKHIKGLQIEQTLELRRSFFRDDEIRVQYAFYTVKDMYTRSPENILGGLTKIGGLIAIAKVLSYLSVPHRLLFEK
jgi:hypothetical protein